MAEFGAVVCCAHGAHKCIVGRFNEFFGSETDHPTGKSSTSITVSSTNAKSPNYSCKSSSKEKSSKQDSPAAAAYLGALTSREAETGVQPKEFKIYHKLPKGPTDLEEMAVHLPLYMVHRNKSGSPRHYPIVTMDLPNRQFLRVAMGKYNDDEGTLFETVDELIRYYTASTSNFAAGVHDVFPV